MFLPLSRAQLKYQFRSFMKWQSRKSSQSRFFFKLWHFCEIWEQTRSNYRIGSTDKTKIWKLFKDCWHYARERSLAPKQRCDWRISEAFVCCSYQPVLSWKLGNLSLTTIEDKLQSSWSSWSQHRYYRFWLCHWFCHFVIARHNSFRPKVSKVQKFTFLFPYPG